MVRPLASLATLGFLAALLSGCGGLGSMNPAPSAQGYTNVRSRGVTIRPSTSNSASKTIRVNVAGGAFGVPAFGGFSGQTTYNANNAPTKTKLTLTNSGATNLLNAPTPVNNGVPVLYLQASISGAASVTFNSGSNLMKLLSASITKGALYEVDVYSNGSRVESYAANVAKPGKVFFQTPFSGLSIYSGTPVTIELVPIVAAALYVSCPFCGSNGSGSVNEYDALNPGNSIKSFATPQDTFAYSLASDDAQNLYIGVEDSSFTNVAVQELLAGGGSFTYTNRLDYATPANQIAPGAGPSPLFDVVAGGAYYTFLQQGVNSSNFNYDPNLAATSVTLASNDYGPVGGQTPSGGWEVDYSNQNLGLALTALPFRLAFDPNGSLIVTELPFSTGAGGGVVAVFPRGQTTPSEVFDQGGCPRAAVLGNGGAALYVLDFGPGCNGASSVLIYSYPQGALLNQLVLGYAATDLAVSPRVVWNVTAYKRSQPGSKSWFDFAKPSLKNLH